jgi:serine/threonine-protein kinase
VDALGIDASKARDDAEGGARARAAAQAALAGQREAMKLAMAEILRWEGRSAMQEPYRELAAAYRAAADVTDAWLVMKAEAQVAERETAQRKTEVDDLEFQIKELRGALAAQSEGQEREEERFQRGVSEAGKRADELDRELLEMASRFCAPLRMRPELIDLFPRARSRRRRLTPCGYASVRWGCTPQPNRRNYRAVIAHRAARDFTGRRGGGEVREPRFGRAVI